jgi:hypothetical protein
VSLGIILCLYASDTIPLGIATKAIRARFC